MTCFPATTESTASLLAELVVCVVGWEDLKMPIRCAEGVKVKWFAEVH